MAGGPDCDEATGGQSRVAGGRVREGVDISLPARGAGWLTVLRSLAGETP